MPDFTNAVGVKIPKCDFVMNFTDDNISIRQNMNALERTLVARVNTAAGRERWRVIVWNFAEHRVDVEIGIQHRDR